MGNKWNVCKINSLVNIMSSYISYYQKQYRKHNREKIRQLKQEYYMTYINQSLYHVHFVISY